MSAPNGERVKVSNSLGEMFMVLSRQIASASNFQGYTWKEDMTMYAVECCIRYVENFDITRDNPFAFFTQIIVTAFIRVIQKEKREINKKRENKERFMDECFVSYIDKGKKQYHYDNFVKDTLLAEEEFFKKMKGKPPKIVAVWVEALDNIISQNKETKKTTNIVEVINNG
jgi:DNA-directed RNA polymerase specialized sigma subunit